MTHHPDDHDRSGDLDEDAVWAEIVAKYGDRPEVGPPVAGAAEPSDSGQRAVDPEDRPLEPDEPRDPRPRHGVFDRSYLESQEVHARPAWDDEGHYHPPPPPPLPYVAPRRLVAWIGLFGAPTLMLLAIVLGWGFPTWVMGLLVAWFVGGFLYLVAKMPKTRGDGWSGDDGAVV